MLRERVAAMKAIWTSDEAQFHGEHVDFDPIWSWPKPMQKPHPPILLGTGSARGRQRVVDYCDGWMPIAGRDDVVAGIADLRTRADGRRPRPGVDLDHHLRRAPRCPSASRSTGMPDVERVVFGLPPQGGDEVLPVVDRYAALMRSIDG